MTDPAFSFDATTSDLSFAATNPTLSVLHNVFTVSAKEIGADFEQGKLQSASLTDANLNLEAANPSDSTKPYVSVGFTDGNFAYNAGSTTTAASLMVSASPHLAVNLPAIGISFDQTLPTVSVNFLNGTLFSFNFHVNMNLGFVDLNIPKATLGIGLDL